MTVELCLHGYFLKDCLTCYKHDGQCDYGSCEAPATRKVEYSRRGKVYESRAMCKAHASKSSKQLPKTISTRELVA